MGSVVLAVVQSLPVGLIGFLTAFFVLRTLADKVAKKRFETVECVRAALWAETLPLICVATVSAVFSPNNWYAAILLIVVKAGVSISLYILILGVSKDHALRLEAAIYGFLLVAYWVYPRILASVMNWSAIPETVLEGF